MDIFIKNGIIKKREEVEQTIFKKNFDLEYTDDLPGPYYDKFHNHCHVWKPVSLIKNFKGEQNQSEIKYRKHAGEIPTKGLYCSICHFRLKGNSYTLKQGLEVSVQPYFKKRKYEEDLSNMLKSVKITRNNGIFWDRFYILLKNNHISKYRHLYDSIVKIKKQKNIIINKWVLLSKKLMEPYVYYSLTSFESVSLKISEMTPFQKFKYYHPNYRKDVSFIIRNNYKFNNDYVTIS